MHPEQNSTRNHLTSATNDSNSYNGSRIQQNRRKVKSRKGLPTRVSQAADHQLTSTSHNDGNETYQMH